MDQDGSSTRWAAVVSALMPSEFSYVESWCEGDDSTFLQAMALPVSPTDCIDYPPFKSGKRVMEDAMTSTTAYL